MKTIHTYLKPISPFKKIFGTIVLIFSIYIIMVQSILFGFFMMSFAVYLISTEGSQINFNSKTYRNIWSIFSIHFGKWKAIPEFEYISVFKGMQKQRVNSLSASMSFSDEVFYVNLFYNRNKHITFYKTFEKEKAFKVAKDFKKAFELDILDATEKKSLWMN